MIYFAEAIGAHRIKIGFTAGNPARRVAELAQPAPFKVELLLAIEGDKRRERQLHEIFTLDRRKGEWFAASPDLRVFICALSDASESDRAAIIEETGAKQRARWTKRYGGGATFAEQALEITRDCIERCAKKHGVAPLAEALGRDQTTVRHWLLGENIPGFDSIAAMAKGDPESFAPLREHFATPRPAINSDTTDRLARIERELDAIRREAA